MTNTVISPRFSLDGQALCWRRGNELLRVEAWGRDSVRVRASVLPRLADADWALLPPAATEAAITFDGGDAVLRNGKMTVRVAETGWTRFYHSETGAVLLEERPHLRVRDFRALAGDAFHLEARFMAYPGERIYGLGQHKHGFLDQQGCVIELQQENSEISIPFYVSSRGYGFLWHNPAVGRAEFARNQTCWVAERTQQLDYWVTAGDTPAEILRHYAAATGFPTALPEWALGFWQCKLRYQTQDELLAVAREHTRRGLPLSVIVIDYFHWTMMGDWQFDPACWPDPQAMVDELAALGVRVMVSVWPTVNPNSANFAALQERGLLVRTERGLPRQLAFVDTTPDGQVAAQYYDATHPEARRFLWTQIREHYYKYGIKIWWLDACEPEVNPLDPDHLRYYLGNGAEVGNLYPLAHQQAFYDGMRGEGETEIITLCRSAWAGSQRYGAAIWSGDIASTFASLQQQIRAGLNMAMSGIPWWTTDIGGFYGGNVEDATFRELVVRWFQYGVFCPLCRLHGVRQPDSAKSGGPNEVWSFGAEAYTIIRAWLFLRERLRPYLHRQMQNAQQTGLPPMRPLFVDFPADPGCVAIDDQFMLGPDLLAAPVAVHGARARPVYLPAGANWLDAWTGAEYAGGATLTADAPLARIPVYLRVGGSLAADIFAGLADVEKETAE